MMEREYGILLNSLRDLDGHYCLTSSVPEFSYGTLEAAQAEIKERNTGRCTRDRCVNDDRRCGNRGQPHMGYFSITHRSKK